MIGQFTLKQDRVIVERNDSALELQTVDQEDGDRAAFFRELGQKAELRWAYRLAAGRLAELDFFVLVFCILGSLDLRWNRRNLRDSAERSLVYCVLFCVAFMRFKNLLVYRLGPQWNVEPRILEKLLAGRALQPCNSFEMESHGWLPPKEGDPFLFALNRHWLLTLGVEQKLLPASIIRQVAVERAAELAKKQGHSIGRKQMREIKERVLDELLPRALTRRLTTAAWVDPDHRWFVVDAAADAKGERVLETLRKSGNEFPAKRLDTQCRRLPQ